MIMNILTFDLEEWYIEKAFWGARSEKYDQFDHTFNILMDQLDQLELKATFFCVGRLATDFPYIVKEIVRRGHEVGCHSNNHTWLNKMTEKELWDDTQQALKALQDVSGQKVISYRAPAFSITQDNKWAVPVLADCGIENDASIFPTSRELGGYQGFPQDTPCRISYQGATLKEYPVGLISLFGKRMAYSGGGYFRLFPYWAVSRMIKRRSYNICYFHLVDMIKEETKLLSKEEFENYFKEPGTLKNRLVRYAKSSIGTSDGYAKIVRLLSNHPFISIIGANNQIDWNTVLKVNL